MTESASGSQVDALAHNKNQRRVSDLSRFADRPAVAASGTGPLFRHGRRTGAGGASSSQIRSARDLGLRGRLPKVAVPADRYAEYTSGRAASASRLSSNDFIRPISFSSENDPRSAYTTSPPSIFRVEEPSLNGQ